MDAYDYCKYMVETWPNRWTGSVGEKESGDWVEQELARMGYETRQTRFDCPGWEYDGEELYLEGEPLDAGAQFFSVGCDVTAPLAAVKPDGQGGFTGEVAGKIALVKETGTTDVTERNPMLLALEAAGAVAAIMESEYAETYSTKMFRTPDSKLPSAGVSGEVGKKLFAAVEVKEKWGYIDKTGRYVVKPQYDFAREFSEGLASVMVGRRFGYIDRAGKMVIEPQFDQGFDFDRGVASVQVNEKMGYIDKSGKYVWEPTDYRWAKVTK